MLSDFKPPQPAYQPNDHPYQQFDPQQQQQPPQYPPQRQYQPHAVEPSYSSYASYPNPKPQFQDPNNLKLSDLKGTPYNQPLFRLTPKRKILLGILAIVAIVATVCFAVFHHNIVDAFLPLQKTVQNSGKPYWLIPVAVLVVLSIPPLFGHELALLIIGLIWKLWEGFGIAAAGTIIGEGLTFFLCKYVLRKHSERLESKNAIYGCVARLMRERGFQGLMMMVLVRYSVIPGHVVTAIQSTIGVPFWKYIFAIVASLPKQLVFVYLGTVYENTNNNSNGHNRERRISYIVLGVSVVITIIAFQIIRVRARKYLPEVIADMQQKEFERHNSQMSPTGSGSTRVGEDVESGPKIRR